MHAARTRAAGGGGRLHRMGVFWRPVGVLAVAAVVAVLAALGFTTDIFRFGAEPTSAQVDGVVSRADADAIVLVTAGGRLTIRIGDNTIVLDANGKPINWGDITPGRSARIEVEEEGGQYSAQRIDVDDDDKKGHGAEVEFKGAVKSVSGNSVAVTASFGTATVVIGPESKVDGVLAPGARVEVHAFVQNDGTYLAKEIEVKGDGGGNGGDDEGGGDGDGGGDGGGGGGGDDFGGSDASGHGSDGSGSDDEPEEEDD